MVISFPVKVPEAATVAAEMSAIDQLNTMKFLQTHWADNSVSVTVYYHQQELPAIKAWLEENYDTDVKSVSFLMHSGHGFNQAPYIPIEATEYYQVQERIQPLTNIVGEGLENMECALGLCPVK
jgi:hypothetical protein